MLVGGRAHARHVLRWRPTLPSSCLGSMDVLLLIVGLAVGVGGALALQRRAGQQREREQQLLRDELKAMSLDVLRQTGEALAERLEHSRGAEEERATGEMAKRTEEIKGMVGPVQEKLGRMESEIGRLERERRQAQGELGQMIRHLGDGVGPLRQEPG